MPVRPGVPPHFIVIVPGYMGSKLRDRESGKVVWVDFDSIPANPFKWDDWLNGLFDAMTYPNDALEPAGIVEQVQFLLPWVKQEHYGRLLAYLETLGYKADFRKYPEAELDVYTFPYDWRQDNRISARQLGEAIERWRSYHPGAQAWLMGHSNGGIVSRWYVEKEGGKDRVGRLFLFGSPWDGAPKGMGVIKYGLEMMWRNAFTKLYNIPERSRAMIRSFPSAYQLVPRVNPFLHNVQNEVIDPFMNTLWLDTETERQMLAEGKRFNEELGTHLSVESLCFFGRQKSTVTGGIARFDAGGGWQEIEWQRNEAGDGTVPERSALHPEAHEKWPFIVGHGDIYVAEPVLEFLKWELIDRYFGMSRAAVETPNLRVVFEPEKDVFAPGEPVGVWATVYRPDGEPISKSRVEAQLTWVGPLPGMTPPAALPAASEETRLRERADAPGRYETALTAPVQEGNYRIVASVIAPGQRPIKLEELIAIEGDVTL